MDRLDYSGILSSHSWSTPDAYPAIARLGGFIAPYAGDSTGFVDKWRYHVGRADRRYFFGLGFGADINGLGAQGDPRGADAEDPVTYPFRGLGGVTVGRQVSGRRVYDVNVDGVAHYGLYPDWVEDLRRLAGGAIVEDLARGSEAYLQMWERALGVEGNGCADGLGAAPGSGVPGPAAGRVDPSRPVRGGPARRADRPRVLLLRAHRLRRADPAAGGLRRHRPPAPGGLTRRPVEARPGGPVAAGPAAGGVRAGTPGAAKLLFGRISLTGLAR